jgi:hypothetical protein
MRCLLGTQSVPRLRAVSSTPLHPFYAALSPPNQPFLSGSLVENLRDTTASLVTPDDGG